MEELSPNFTREEFACKCGCGFADVDMRLVHALQVLRDRLGHPIRITSGCRCPAHNKKCGGTIGSMHLSGIAADITVPGMGIVDVYVMALDILMFRGFGLDVERQMLHLDVRKQFSRWLYRDGNAVKWEA